MITDEYLRMVRALPDGFFEGWEWQAGDKALVNNEIWTVFGGNANGMVVIGENLQQFSIGNLDFSYKIGDKARPIPSQEQLQNYILLKNSNIKGLYHLHKIFDGWVTVYLIMNKFENYNQAWLAFAVSMTLNKEWNGTSWEKMK